MPAVLVEHRYHVSDRRFFIVECRECLAVLNSGHHYSEQGAAFAESLASEHNGTHHVTEDRALIITRTERWELVATGPGDDEWVARIHHPEGSSRWHVHFRADIPPESYATRKDAVAALEARFNPTTCPDTDTNTPTPKEPTQ